MSVVTKVVSGLVTAVLLAAAMWLYGSKPRLEAGMQNPITNHGRIGAVAGNRVFSVKVGRADVASAVAKRDILRNATAMPTSGIFVIVYLEIRSNQKPFQPGHVRLATRGGLSYDESGRPAIYTSHGDYQPMLWGQASYVFEIPKDRLAGARLIVGESAPMNQLSAEADIDLGIDNGRAARLLAHPPGDYILKTT